VKKLTFEFWALVGFLLLLGKFGLAEQTRSNEQERIFRVGYEKGYEIGFDRGRIDRAYGRLFEFENSTFQRATSGFQESMKHRRDYKDGFRVGYRPGYTDGYFGYPFRPDFFFASEESDDLTCGAAAGRARPDQILVGRRNLEMWVFDLGWQSGYIKGLGWGRLDFNNRESFNPSHHSIDQEAKNQYRPEYRSRDMFIEGFVQGVEAGYKDGFGGYYTGDPYDGK